MQKTESRVLGLGQGFEAGCLHDINNILKDEPLISFQLHYTAIPGVNLQVIDGFSPHLE